MFEQDFLAYRQGEKSMKKFKDYFECVPALETERFLLVPFAREDMDEYFDILRDDRVQQFFVKE